MGSQAYPHQDFWGNPSWDILELHKQGTRHSCFILFIFFFCVFCILPYFPLFAFKTRSCYYMAQASFRVLYLLRAGITVRHHHENFVCPVNGYTGRVFWLQKTRWDCDYYIKYSLSHFMYNTGSRHRSSFHPWKDYEGTQLCRNETDTEIQHLNWNSGSISGSLPYLGSRMLGSIKSRKAMTMKFQWLPPHKALRLFLNAAQSQPN